MSKVSSTPSEPSRAVFDSFAKAGLATSDISYFVHGTTVATNALIERRGADVALLTTDGFRDILRIQRVTRPNHFDLHWVKPRHFVPARPLRRHPRAGAARRLGARPARRGRRARARSSACATAATSARSASPTCSRSSTPTTSCARAS